jgi:hypothetical protein
MADHPKDPSEKTADLGEGAGGEVPVVGLHNQLFQLLSPKRPGDDHLPGGGQAHCHLLLPVTQKVKVCLNEVLAEKINNEYINHTESNCTFKNTTEKKVNIVFH